MGRARIRPAYFPAQLRLSLALAAGYDRRPFAAATRMLAGSPRVDEARLGGVPATVFRPGRRLGPWPAALVVPGVTRLGRRHPAFVGLGRGLAAAGLLAAVVEPTGLSVGELTPDTVIQARRAAEAFSSRADVRGGRLALAGVSGGATIALLLAASPDLAGRVSAVAALAPCCDIREALRLVTTDRYLHHDALVPYRTGAFFRLVLARSAIAWLEEGPDQRALRGHLLGLDDYVTDPLRGLRSWPVAELGPEARTLTALLANEEAGRFDELYGRLTDSQREAVDTLSPIRTPHAIAAPVELVVAREDKYIPLEDAIAFSREWPQARVTVIDSLEHAVPRVSSGAARDLARLDGVVVRLLAAACSQSYSGR